MKPLELGQLPSPLMLFGGPYSNLPATTALIGESQRLGIPPGQVICTGDIVAYCGNPEETVSLVRDWGCHIVMGNCEESLALTSRTVAVVSKKDRCAQNYLLTGITWPLSK